MSDSESQPTICPNQASQAWEAMSSRVEALVRAWDDHAGPPNLLDFIPPPPDGLRRPILVELVKVDLEYRWRHADRRLLEDYCREFPDLLVDELLPCDLIYEEFHIRRQAGEVVGVAEYAARFPRQAAELQRLLGEGPGHSTSLGGVELVQEFEPGESIDDFDLLARLGRGAFAAVFLARQRSMQRLVALKVSADRGDEPQTMAQLDHPHVVRVFDQRVLSAPKVRLLYMQYIPGGTLEGAAKLARNRAPGGGDGRLLLQAIDEALRGRGESPPEESSLRRRLARLDWPATVCWLGARLAGALDYAHRRGVLHRDLKPANVLLTAEGSPKLADFNISFCAKVDGATAAAFFGGSLGYMSPEQLEAYHPASDRRPSELDARSDVYSLGIVLWELLTGHRPFADEPVRTDYADAVLRLWETRRRALTPELLARLPGDCPLGVREAICRALAPLPEDRFASAGEMARQLELCLHPRVQSLVSAPSARLMRVARHWPWLGLVGAGALPNLAASALNIAYNGLEIVPALGVAAERIFLSQVMTVNPIAYVGAIVGLSWLAWPVMQRVAAAATRRPPENLDPGPVLRRALILGDLVAWTSAAEWAISGLVFPLWLQAEVGQNAMNLSQYAHFMASQLVCGLLAATQSFFCVTFVAVRAFVPPLLPNRPHEPARLALGRLAARARFQFGLSVAAPLLAIIPMAIVDTDRLAFLVLAGVGLLGYGLSYVLARAVQNDIEALTVACASSAEAGDSQAETTDAFWRSDAG